MNRAKCPICQRFVATFAAGDFRTHGPQNNRCPASRRTPEQVNTIPELTEEQREMMRECWRRGDWRPVEREFGIIYPQRKYSPQPIFSADSIEDELAELIADAREWITSVYERAEERGRVA